MTTNDVKTCTRCRRTLPASTFGRVRADRDWLRSKCNNCEAERRRNSRKGAHRG